MILPIVDGISNAEPKKTPQVPNPPECTIAQIDQIRYLISSRRDKIRHQDPNQDILHSVLIAMSQKVDCRPI